MKKFVFIVLILAVAVYLTACHKKQESVEEMNEPMTMEALSKIGTETQAQVTADTNIQIAQNVAQNVPEAKLESLPNFEPHKPTTKEIQTALQNAGYYTGPIDGKSGSLTKKAIEEFQKVNGLVADGKVGPKTWAALSPHLNPPLEPQSKKSKKKR